MYVSWIFLEFSGNFLIGSDFITVQIFRVGYWNIPKRIPISDIPYIHEDIHFHSQAEYFTTPKPKRNSGAIKKERKTRKCTGSR